MIYVGCTKVFEYTTETWSMRLLLMSAVHKSGVTVNLNNNVQLSFLEESLNVFAWQNIFKQQHTGTLNLMDNKQCYI